MVNGELLLVLVLQPASVTWIQARSAATFCQ
jgi:hypothetical protein